MDKAAVATLLRPVAHLFDYLTTTRVHPNYFPYVFAPTLHAARISIVFQANVKASRPVQSWGTYLAGFLVMSWGGSVISHILLSLPPPQLYIIDPYINYLSVHLILTALFHIFPALLNPRLFDTFLFPLDALLRVNAITGALSLVASPTHHINPFLRNSLLTHVILGAAASAGGGISAATLGTWTQNWAFSTPVFLRGSSQEGLDGWLGTLMDTLDVWGGALVVCIYDILTADPAFSSSPTVYSFLGLFGFESIPILIPLGAKAAATIVLGTLFGVRVWWAHWRGRGLGKWDSRPDTRAMKGKKTKVQ